MSKQPATLSTYVGLGAAIATKLILAVGVVYSLNHCVKHL